MGPSVNKHYAAASLRYTRQFSTGKLAGGAEFGGRMEIPDRRAIELAGGPDARMSIIPLPVFGTGIDRRFSPRYGLRV